MLNCQVSEPQSGSAGFKPRAQASSRCSNPPQNPLEPLPGQDTMAGWHRAGFTRDHLIYAIQLEFNRTQQQRGWNLPGTYTQFLSHTPDWKTTMQLPGLMIIILDESENKKIWKIRTVLLSMLCIDTTNMTCVFFRSKCWKSYLIATSNRFS